MEHVLKILNIVFLASIKYFWAPPYALVFDLGVWETLLALEVGGIAGYLFFFYASHFVFKQLSAAGDRLYLFTPVKVKFFVDGWRERQRAKREKRKIFTRRNKLIVKLRRRSGMWGIIILTPVLLSIPVGAVLGNKYYSNRKTFLPLMIVSIFLWGIISVLIFNIFPEII
jgi:hypothetical protein